MTFDFTEVAQVNSHTLTAQAFADYVFTASDTDYTFTAA